MKKKWNRHSFPRSKEDVVQFLQAAEKYAHRVSAALRPTSWWRNAGLALPRIMIGIMLISSQWRLKMGMPVNQLQEMVPEDKYIAEWLTWMDPNVLLWVDRIESLALGGMFVTGLNTRLTALSILWTVSERVYLSMIHPLTSSFLMTVLMLVAAFSLIFGSGKFGADYWIVTFFRKRRRERPQK
ncbi:MAG: hypothetical protein R3283_05985 [Balneolaceae bacterium]|nr:hypothetical protein [Balneolaceae bacterium]